MERLRKRIHIKFVATDVSEIMFKLRRKSTFTGSISYDNFECFALKKETVVFKKPIMF